MIEALLRALGRLVVRRPGAVGLAALALTAAAAALLPRLRIDPDVSALLPGDHPAVRLVQATSDQDSSRRMFLLLRGDDLGERLPALVESLEASPFLESVVARREAFLPGAEDQGELLARLPDAALERLEAALQPEARRAAIAASKARLAQDPLAGRETVLRDPLGLRWVLDEAQRALLPAGVDPDSPYLWWPERGLALLQVMGTAEPFDVQFSRDLLADLEQRLAGVPFDALGGYDVARRDAGRIRADMQRSLGSSIPLLLLFLALSTRSFWRPHLVVLPVGLAVLWALGFGGAWLGPLTPLAVSAAAILMGLGVDFCIHYLDRYREERERGDHAFAVLAAHVGTGHALLLGLVTTVSAFVSMALGSFPGLASFGWLLTLGLVGSWLAALFVLPLLAARVPLGTDRPSGVVRWLGARVRGPAGPSLGLALALVAAAGWLAAGLGQLRFDADARHLRPAEDRFAERVEELEQALGASPLPVRAWVPAGRDPQVIATGLEGLRSEGLVARTSGAFEAVPGSRRRLALVQFQQRVGDWVAGTREDLRAAGFRPEPFEAGLEELRQRLGSGAGEPAAPDFTWEGTEYRSMSLAPTVTPRGRLEREALADELRAALGEDILQVNLAGVGDPLGPVLAADLARALGLCALVVLLVVGAALRRPREVLAALAPVCAGLGAVLLALVLTDFPLHPGNLLALPLVLGLGVDDGIHMVLRWRQSGADPLTSTGTSVWRTSVSTVIGFGSLAFAASPAIASLGLLAAVGAAACFLATVVLVPLLLGRHGG